MIIRYTYIMDDTSNKKTCSRCSKKDCEKCVEEKGNFFCCQVCCDEHEKEKAGLKKKEEPPNVCNFC